ncbi:flagellar export protein FliJ [Aquabacterium sp.]|jgi:flagellar FliJ protein|uniref:flagellar export protein FliJ n=1 Tax=Aquabacterium sp. TaxID=1872578 RepID=UPI0025BF4B2C|nr:flagellar export protein FliJ [Aquabacterium sp.]
MSAIQSLLMVLESAEKARDDAQSALEAARQAHESARQQAQSLGDWRRDYQNRWQQQFRQTGGMEIMRCYQDFMLRLADAVSDQDRKVEQAKAHMERLRLQLIERERKVAAVAQLIDRRQVEALQRQNRQEQKATDEIAARAALNTSGFGAGGSPMASRSL